MPICLKSTRQGFRSLNKLVKRFILRRDYENTKQVLDAQDTSKTPYYYPQIAYICGKCKKLDDGNYYTFRVYKKVTTEGKNKQVSIIFKAKEVMGSSKLQYTHKLPKFTDNTDSIIKVAQFMIEYCLSINENYELFMDNDLYKSHRNELKDIQTIEFHDTQASEACM